VPTAGPYYVAAHVPNEEVLLRRNPGYRGSRARRPDAIRILNRGGDERALGRVERGEADYVPAEIDSATARRMEARYGPGSTAAKAGHQRFFVHTAPQLDHIVFNTSRGPFRSVRLRRAVNFALDRRTISRQGFFDGLPSQPTDQYIPPSMPGFRDADIYPFTPDLATARRLAGDRRRAAFLYTLGGPSFARGARVIKANLARIGIDVQIVNQGDKLFEQVQNEDEPYDMVMAGWVADRPDPIDFLDQLDSRIESRTSSGKLNIARFADPAYDRRLDAAARLGSPARELALGRLDARIARTAAPWAAIASERFRDFFSDRVGCQRYSPSIGIDLAELCIRGD
jgi:ABC-type oligopeptide transport system substrate-binding subunit